MTTHSRALLGARHLIAAPASPPCWRACSAPVAPAQAAGSEYVALGDSYSSGTGTGSYLADGSECLRSPYAYPSLIAASGGHALNFRACSGADHPRRHRVPR